MRAGESVTPFSNAAAGTSPDFYVDGGNYMLTLGATGSAGTATLKSKCSDGSYQAVTPRETALTAAGVVHYDGLAPGQYQLVITVLSANTANLTRVPGE